MKEDWISVFSVVTRDSDLQPKAIPLIQKVYRMFQHTLFLTVSADEHEVP